MQTLEAPPRAATHAPAAAAATPARQWLRLSVGDAVHALPIDHVREILQVGRLTPLPRIPSVIRGVMNLRGAVVPVIDLGARLNGQPIAVGRRSSIIVVELPAAAGRASTTAGVMVDAVFEVVDVGPGAASPAPALGTRIAPQYLTGVVQLQGRLLHLLDIERVLSPQELTELVAAHAV